MKAARALFLVVLAGCASVPQRQALAEEYYNLGNSYLAVNDFSRAVEFFRRAIDVHPDLLQAHHNLTLALVESGRAAEALTVLARLLIRDPSNVALLELAAYARYATGELEETIPLYDSILKIAPGDRGARYNRAIVQWELGRPEEAARGFRDLISRDGTADRDEVYYDSLYNLSILAVESGQTGEAVEHLERYLEWKPDDLPLYHMLAGLYRKQERYLPALETYDALLARAPGDAEAWMGRAEILLTTVEDPRAGLAALRTALKSGLDDRKRLEALLADPLVLEKERVEEVVSTWVP